MVFAEDVGVRGIRQSGFRAWWLAAEVLSALTMGMAFAHLLEAPQKLGYGADLWTKLTQTLYRYFALIGGPIEVANLLVLVGLGVLARRRGSRGRLVLVAAGCFAAALAGWVAVVQPVNAHVGSWSASSVPHGWRGWRSRWEFGHIGRFALMLAGYVWLAIAALGARQSIRPAGMSDRG